MLYAKVVLGLPVEGSFDYSVPRELRKCIKEGVRVWVQFGNARKLGYVVGVSPTTNIKRVKPVSEIIDASPLLDKNMLSLARRFSDYYGCSWGEAIETVLPPDLRKGRKITTGITGRKRNQDKNRPEAVLIHDLNKRARWDIYLMELKEAVSNNKSAIVLLPDVNSVFRAKELISGALGITPVVLYRGQPKETEAWLEAGRPDFNVVVATRSGIFAPVHNLGLVIIEEEQDTVYKQDQVPHYHARQVAFMRTETEKAKLILGSVSPSLESFYLAKKNKIKYTVLPRITDFPEVKIVDMRSEQRYIKQKNIILSKYLQDAISRSLESKGKILLFLNRRGFATSASCRNCGTVLKCPRCNINLVFHFKGNILSCRYCNFKMDAPTICPGCNSSYIRYLGMGTEKIESEVARIFPQARVSGLDGPECPDIESADIFVSTASVIKKTNYSFDLVGVLSMDNSLNRIDFRSTEKTFALLSGLLVLADKKMVIQTNLPGHYSLLSIQGRDTGMFYGEELKQRKQLGFPPYRHLCLVKLRAREENRVKEAGTRLFERLGKYAGSSESVKVASLNPAEPAKLRGNFYWQILLKADSPLKVIKFLRLHLKNFPHSGIIVTVDMDPV